MTVIQRYLGHSPSQDLPMWIDTKWEDIKEARKLHPEFSYRKMTVKSGNLLPKAKRIANRYVLGLDGL